MIYSFSLKVELLGGKVYAYPDFCRHLNLRNYVSACALTSKAWYIAFVTPLHISIDFNLCKSDKEAIV